jgi:hypothetical protein
MSNRILLLQWLEDRLRDRDGATTPLQRESCLDQAVKRYSQRRPRLATVDFTGDGSTTLYELPSDWMTEWSSIELMEYPQGREPMQVLLSAHYRLYQTLTGPQLRFSLPLADGEKARMTYRAAHIATNGGTTIPATDQEAVATLGAALAAKAIATHYASQTDSTLTLDTADHSNRSSNFAARARMWEEEFTTHVPLRHVLRGAVRRA